MILAMAFGLYALAAARVYLYLRDRYTDTVAEDALSAALWPLEALWAVGEAVWWAGRA